MSAVTSLKASSALLLWWLAGMVAAGEAADGKDPVHWLERMNQAVARLAYHGHFVYLSGRSLEGMRIRHRIVDGRPVESLLSLNGEPREVIRDARTLTIVVHQNGKVRRVRQPAGTRFSPMKPLEATSLSTSYRLVMGRPARVADRWGVVVLFVPRDDLRYGYRLTLDREWALPLDLMVIDAEGEVVSRIMFTDLQVETGDDPQPQPAAPLTVAEAPAAAPAAEAETNHAGWRFESLPAGFRLLTHRHYADGHQDHFIFSDGLATISAYVEPLAEGDRPFNGRARLGSIHAVGRPLAERQLTVVGEVPYKTLELIAGALKPAGD